jgi:hypothetical protein
MDTYGVNTAATLNTITNTAANFTFATNRTNAFQNKRLRVIAGTLQGTEVTPTTNGATAIAAAVGTPATDSVFVIYEIPTTGAGIALTWLYGLSNTTNKGNLLLRPRGGGSNIFDILDITKNQWYVSTQMLPTTTTLTTGSMYAYDGVDSLVFTKDATGRIYDMNLNTFEINASGTTPYVHHTAIIGNRMEIIQTADGLKYLYIMRHTGREVWRTLKFW